MHLLTPALHLYQHQMFSYLFNRWRLACFAAGPWLFFSDTLSLNDFSLSHVVNQTNIFIASGMRNSCCSHLIWNNDCFQSQHKLPQRDTGCCGQVVREWLIQAKFLFLMGHFVLLSSRTGRVVGVFHKEHWVAVFSHCRRLCLLRSCCSSADIAVEAFVKCNEAGY